MKEADFRPGLGHGWYPWRSFLLSIPSWTGLLMPLYLELPRCRCWSLRSILSRPSVPSSNASQCCFWSALSSFLDGFRFSLSSALQSKILGLGCTFRALDKLPGTYCMMGRWIFLSASRWPQCEVIVEPHWFRRYKMEKSCQELHMWTRSLH